MIKRLLQVGIILAGFASMPSWALTINDAGVVGTIEQGTQNSSVAIEIQWSQYLLNMGLNETITVNGDNINAATENYATRTIGTDYSAILTDGFKQDGGSLTGWANYEYVLGKYDGQNAGIVLFNVADYMAASGTSLPALSTSIWGNAGQYRLSHWTGFNHNGVPEPGMVGLLSIGLLGMVAARRRMKL